MTNEEVFEVLRTKGKELSDWLKKNFDQALGVSLRLLPCTPLPSIYLQDQQRPVRPLAICI